MSATSLPTAVVMELVRSVSVRAAIGVQRELMRGIRGLDNVASTAPFFGVLGTVIGIVYSFPGVCGERSYNMAASAGRLAEAIVPTALGLLIAIAAWWIRTCLTNHAETLALQAASMPDELVRQLGARASVLGSEGSWPCAP